MKKLITISILSLFYNTAMNAQFLNASFKNWTKTTRATVLPFVGSTNITFTDPDNWTSLNQISNVQVPIFGLNGKEAVKIDSIIKKDSTASARLKTEEMNVPTMGNVRIPGVLFNGSAILDFTALTGGAGFMFAPGAGQAINSRPKAIKGFYKYLPVSNDTFQMIAVLRKGDEIIATADFQSSVIDTANWKEINLKFTYNSCTMPDTLFVLFSSLNLASGGSGGNKGTTLWVDSVYIDSLTGYNPPLPPNAIDDRIDLKCLEIKQIDFLANDKTCNLPVKIIPMSQSKPIAGTAVYTGTGLNMKLNYTTLKSNDTMDIITYAICDTVKNLCDTARIFIKITPVYNKSNTDTISVAKNDKVNIFIKTNDSITNCYVPTLTVTKNPSKGTVVIKSNSYIEYTTLNNKIGKDTFMYKLCGTLNLNTICDSAYAYINITGTNPSSTGSINNQNALIYPNPSNDYVYVQQKNAGNTIEIYSLTGQKMIFILNAKTLETIQLEKFIEGIYILKITNQKDKSSENTLINVIK